MLDKTLNYFFVIFNKEFKSSKKESYESVMLLAVSHFFGIFNPKQLADYIGIDHRNLYRKLKELSLYRVRQMMLKLMIKETADRLKSILSKSDATKSRASISFSVDDSVIDRFGKIIRCTWKWYSGNCKKVVNGQDLLGIVLSLNGIALPVSMRYCSKQGRANTNKPDMLIDMFKELKEEFNKYGVDILSIPITMDSWFASTELKDSLYELGFSKIIVAGKGNYVFEINGIRKQSSEWKKSVEYSDNNWAVNVPSVRCSAISKTFGNLILFFFKQNRTRNYYLMSFSKSNLRAAEIWHIWKQHHVIENFWKQLKSVFKIKEMRMHGDSLYLGLLIKVLAYLIAMLLKASKSFFKLSLLKIRKEVNRNNNLENIIERHFHLAKVLKPKTLRS